MHAFKCHNIIIIREVNLGLLFNFFLIVCFFSSRISAKMKNINYLLCKLAVHYNYPKRKVGCIAQKLAVKNVSLKPRHLKCSFSNVIGIDC